MIPEPAARRYAEAAHLIAVEEGKQEAWAEGLRAIAALFGDPDAAQFLTSSRIPMERKRDLVEKTLAGTDKNVLNLALLLLRRNRTQLGPQIAEAYQEILDREKGISHALITTAVPLSDSERSDVQKKLVEITGGPVEVRTQVDEEILGGLVIRIGDRLIDGSTRSRLVALKHKLSGRR